MYDTGNIFLRAAQHLEQIFLADPRYNMLYCCIVQQYLKRHESGCLIQHSPHIYATAQLLHVKTTRRTSYTIKQNKTGGRTDTLADRHTTNYSSSSSSPQASTRSSEPTTIGHKPTNSRPPRPACKWHAYVTAVVLQRDKRETGSTA